MTTRDGPSDTAAQSAGSTREHLTELRAINERLLIAGLREQELAAELRDVNERLLIASLREQELAAAQEAERADLAVILASIGDAVLVVDRAGTLLRSNAAYARLAGGAHAPLHPEDEQGRPLPPAETPQARAARGETFRLAFAVTHPDGSSGWFEAHGQPLEDHRTGHAVIVIRDITPSNQYRRLQDEFLAQASHELRTPLTSIQGYLDLLVLRMQNTSDHERFLYYATRAQQQAYRLGALVHDLTDVARLQSGKLTLNKTMVDLVLLTTRVVQTARDLPPGHMIDFDAPPDALHVHGDAGRLEQVLLNLLINAFVYAPSTTPITVRLRRVGLELALEVQDYGAGIAADQLPHLFTRFYQIESMPRPAQGGLGLGLFICHEIVVAHRGRIAVASTTGEGTTFTVWLPLMSEPE